MDLSMEGVLCHRFFSSEVKTVKNGFPLERYKLPYITWKLLGEFSGAVEKSLLVGKIDLLERLHQDQLPQVSLEWWQSNWVGEWFIELFNRCHAGWVVSMGCVHGGENKINSVMKYLAVVGKRYISEMEFPWNKKLGRLYILDNEEKATIHSYIQDRWLRKQLVEFTNCQLLKSQK